MNETDWELVRRYCQDQAEDAFAEIVRRHLDLVYSAALRQVHSPQLAEEIAQFVFMKLARNGGKLRASTVLAAWLFQITRSAAIDVVRGETRRKMREQIAGEMNATNATTADWMRIGPVLDEAMGALGDTDRAAVLLRYFENKSLREVGQALGTSDDAAQKRLSRAVDRLRKLLIQRGVSVSATGLAVLLSANAVQAAPVGLALSLSPAAVLTGSTLVATATQAIAMTTLQKALITAILTVAIGTGLYQVRQASVLKAQLRSAVGQQAQFAAQLEQLSRERKDSARQLASLRDENARLNRGTAELLRLRAEVAQSRAEARKTAMAEANAGPKGDVTEAAMRSWLGRVKALKGLPERMPDKTIPELKILSEEDWLELAKTPLDHSPDEINLDDDATARLAFSSIRAKAKDKLMRVLSRALEGYANANSGELPTDAVQLKPYLMNSHFEGPARVVQIPDDAVDDSVLKRYQILASGKLQGVPDDRTILAEIAPVDSQYDTRLKVGKYWMAVGGLEEYAPGKGGKSN